MAIVIPATRGTNKPIDFPTNVRVSPADSGLSEESVFLGFQFRALDTKKFPATPAGHLTPAALKRVEEAVAYCLAMRE